MDVTTEELAARLAAAGVPATGAECEELRAAYALMAPMLRLIRTPGIATAAEPAFIFEAAPNARAGSR